MGPSDQIANQPLDKSTHRGHPPRTTSPSVHLDPRISELEGKSGRPHIAPPRWSVDLRAKLDVHGARSVRGLCLVLESPRLYTGMFPNLTLTSVQIVTAGEVVATFESEQISRWIESSPTFRQHGCLVLTEDCLEIGALDEGSIAVRIDVRNNTSQPVVVAASIGYAAVLVDPVRADRT